MRLALFVGAAALVLSAAGVSSAVRPKTPADNEDRRRLTVDDQADRQSKAIAWTVVAPRDRALGRYRT
jgi:hypothetical protein